MGSQTRHKNEGGWPARLAFSRHDQTLRRIHREGGINGIAVERHLALDSSAVAFIICASANAQKQAFISADRRSPCGCREPRPLPRRFRSSAQYPLSLRQQDSGPTKTTG